MRMFGILIASGVVGGLMMMHVIGNESAATAAKR